MQQRSIKFRAWSPKYSLMINPVDFGIYSGTPTLLELDDVLMEFTGILDKNGNEIYEGDILRDDQKNIFEVKFGELPLDKRGDCVCTYPAFYAKAYGKLGRAPLYECNQIGDWMEIIGNIYENQAILE